MTNRNKASLQALFQTGDVPTGTDYADFIDSNVNLVETSVQTMAGPLSTTELITPRISAQNVVFGGTTFTAAIGGTFRASAATMQLSSTGNTTVSSQGQLNLYGDTSMTIRSQSGGVNGSQITLSSNGNLNISNNNNNINITASGGTISLNSSTTIVSGAFIKQSVAIISAAGTAQSTAAVLTNIVNRGKGIVDGTTTGFMPLANQAGLVQYLFNEGASANLWPPVGGTINGLAANAAYSIAASAMITIVHLTASAMAAG